jgi:transcriptional regulator with XRE-family HTH domain
MSLANNVRMRRARLNWSQKELAAKAGVSQQLINAMENGAVRSTKFINEIALALGCSIADLDPKYGSSVELGDSVIDLDGRHGELPIFGAAEAAVGSVIVTMEPIDFIDRPAPLENVRGGYGLIVANDFMFPEFEIGDFALVNPHLPPIPNSSCLIYSEEKNGTIARLRRLTHITPTEWHVKAWNPPEDYPQETVLPRASWLKCHRVVGRYNRR